jgi:hypothetical protein
MLYNRRVCDLVGVSRRGGRPAGAELRARLLARASARQRPAGGATTDGAPVELTCDAHDGRTLDLRVQSFDVTDEHGALIGRGQLWLDVTGDKELDRMKSSLIATVSHELRTPLATIKGNITSLLADDVQWDAAAQREFLEVASAETDRLSALVTDLLDLSRLQAGTLVIRREPCALRPLAERAAARARPSPGARLRLEIPADLPPVAIDAARIEAVLRNVLEIAAKYAPPGRRLGAPRWGRRVGVRWPTGPGIPPEYRRGFSNASIARRGSARQTSGAGWAWRSAKASSRRTAGASGRADAAGRCSRSACPWRYDGAHGRAGSRRRATCASSCARTWRRAVSRCTPPGRAWRRWRCSARRRST